MLKIEQKTGLERLARIRQGKRVWRGFAKVKEYRRKTGADPPERKQDRTGLEKEKSAGVRRKTRAQE